MSDVKWEWNWRCSWVELRVRLMERVRTMKWTVTQRCLTSLFGDKIHGNQGEEGGRSKPPCWSLWGQNTWKPRRWDIGNRSVKVCSNPNRKAIRISSCADFRFGLCAHWIFLNLKIRICSYSGFCKCLGVILGDSRQPHNWIFCIWFIRMGKIQPHASESESEYPNVSLLWTQYEWPFLVDTEVQFRPFDSKVKCYIGYNCCELICYDKIYAQSKIFIRPDWLQISLS